MKKKKEEKQTCQGCKYLGFWNSGEPFCIKGIDKGCIGSGFKFRVEASTEEEERIMTPEEFEERMKQISATDSGYPGCDMEDRHREMDNLMCELLGSLGYGAGVEIFQETDKWYA